MEANQDQTTQEEVLAEEIAVEIPETIGVEDAEDTMTEDQEIAMAEEAAGSFCVKLKDFNILIDLRKNNA